VVDDVEEADAAAGFIDPGGDLLARLRVAGQEGAEVDHRDFIDPEGLGLFVT